MEEIQAWAAGLEQLLARMGPCFKNAMGRRRLAKYVRGLLADVQRKNGWQLAEEAGESTPYAMQQFLYRGDWDPDDLTRETRRYMIEDLGDPDGVLVGDETGFLKKGSHSVGVQRQYSGTAGRVENCQIGVFLGYVTRHGRGLLDRELYLPASWTKDRERCREAGVPDGVVFRTKPTQLRLMLARAVAEGVPARWVTADCVYGDDPDTRTWLEDQGLGYVLGTRLNDARVPINLQLRVAEGGGRYVAREWLAAAECWGGQPGSAVVRLAVGAAVEVSTPELAAWSVGPAQHQRPHRAQGPPLLLPGGHAAFHPGGGRWLPLDNRDRHRGGQG